MARRFALALVALLLLLLGALAVGRKLAAPRPAPGVVLPRPTPPVPPTPIPARPVTLWFESGDADGRLHPESRDVPAASDDVAFLRSVAAGVVEGPRAPDLLAPFPDGWFLRAAYLLPGGVAVLDVAPPRPAAPDAAATPAPPAPPARWSAGSHEEDAAVQALAVSVAKNMPAVTRVVLLVSGEPAETLAGHVDLSHPIAPDLTRASDEARRAARPAPTPTPSPAPTATPAPPPTPARPPARPKGVTA